MKKLFYGLLLGSFLFTLAVPLTGIVVHKLASTGFLVLCLIHAVGCRKRLGWRRIALLGAVMLAFASGVCSLIFAKMPLVLAVHKVVSITCVFFLAIHIFAYRRGFRRKSEG